jgi:hypothetical protein
MNAKLPLFAAVLALAACKPPEATNLAPLDVDFTWVGTARCTSSPPEFKIGGVPPATRALDFTFRVGGPSGAAQGGGKVAYTGSPVVPAGSFYYLGPCPLGTQNYQFTVQALDGSGTVIGRGAASHPFPP